MDIDAKARCIIELLFDELCKGLVADCVSRAKKEISQGLIEEVKKALAE